MTAPRNKSVKAASSLAELAKVVERLAKKTYKQFKIIRKAERDVYDASEFYSDTEVEEKLLRFAHEILELKERDKKRKD